MILKGDPLALNHNQGDSTNNFCATMFGCMDENVFSTMDEFVGYRVKYDSIFKSSGVVSR